MKLFRFVQGVCGEIHCDCYVAAENYEAAKCGKIGSAMDMKSKK